VVEKQDADDACEDLDGKEMDGGKVRVELARQDPRERSGYRRSRGGYRGQGYRNGYSGERRGDRRGPPGPRTGNRLLVENISSRTSWQDLKDYFRTAGEITYTNVERSGDGVVEFRDRKGLDYALKYKDELELDGRKLRVREEGYYRSKRSSRSRSRSNSRSRSRSSKSATRSSTKSKSRSASRSRSRSRNHDHSERRYRNTNHSRQTRSRSESNSRSRSRERYSKSVKKDRKRARSYSRSHSRN